MGTVQVASVAPGCSSPFEFFIEQTMSNRNIYVSSQPAPSVLHDLEIPLFNGLTEEQAVQAKALLIKYSALLSQSEGELGCTDLITHEIPLVEEVPVHQPNRRLPPSQYETVKAYIKQFLDGQVIQEHSSPYSSPVVVVTKKGGSLRLCVDFRQHLTSKSAVKGEAVQISLFSESG